MDRDKAVARETTAQLQRSVEKAVKKLHEDFGNTFAKSGLNWDVDASSDESSGSGDDQPMDAHGSEDVQVENAEPKEGVSAPEGAEGK